MQQTRTWSDGVETGTTGTASPFYVDFDAVEEMQISTGGADVTMQTPGAVINLISKSGTNQFHGSTRLLVADRSLSSTNVTDDLRNQGASLGRTLNRNATRNQGDVTAATKTGPYPMDRVLWPGGLGTRAATVLAGETLHEPRWLQHTMRCPQSP